MNPLWILGAGAAGLALLAANRAGDAPPEAAQPPSPAPPAVDPSLPPRPAETAAQLLRALPALAENDWSDTQKLAAGDPRLRLSELLARLRALGWRPMLSYTWRSLPSQDLLRARGATTVSFSFHNAVDTDGYPAGLAADLADRRYGWGDDNPGSGRTRGAAAFFAALGAEAKRLGLSWGGDWNQRNLWRHFNLGWDPGHVQAFPNSALPSVQRASLTRILGEGVRKPGSGGYVYRQFWNGYLLIEQGPISGELLLPHGNRQAWEAITAEIGPYPGGGMV